MLLFPGQMPRYLSKEIVSAAFKEQALVWHPDRAPEDTSDAMLGMMVRRMAALNNVKGILGEAILRQCLMLHGNIQPPQRAVNKLKAPIPHVRVVSSRSAQSGSQEPSVA